MKRFWFIYPVLTALACSDIEQPDLLHVLLFGAGSIQEGIVSSDLGGSGRVSTISREGLPQTGFTEIHSDAKARYQDGRVYVINRLGRDNIQVLNPGALFATEREFSVEAGSNPQDFVRFDAARAYVSRYERSTLYVVSPLTGRLTGTIDLGPFAEADGIPEMSAMHLEGSRLFVAVQRLDRNDPTRIFPPTDYSSLLEIDIFAETVVTEHRLPVTNPFSKLRPVNLFGQRHLVVAAPGDIGGTGFDGGVVAFNLDAGSVRPGVLYSEAAAGGDILDVVIKNDSVGYAVVVFADFSGALQRFDPSTGALTGQLAFSPASGGFVAGMELSPDGLLYVADASFTQPGITIYDTNAGDAPLTAAPSSVGLRPTDLVLIP